MSTRGVEMSPERKRWRMLVRIERVWVALDGGPVAICVAPGWSPTTKFVQRIPKDVFVAAKAHIDGGGGSYRCMCHGFLGADSVPNLHLGDWELAE